MDGPLARLSKGTLQRLVLAEAVSAPAALLVLDEPWAGLDAAARPFLGRALRERADAGAAVVVTDHSGAGEATLTPDVHLRVVDGRVESGGAWPGGAAPVRANDPAGVGRGTRTPDTVVIVTRHPATGAVTRHSAPRGEHDALLRALLDAGHSIEEVRRG